MEKGLIKYFLLTGDPEVGKTTIIKKLVESISAVGVKPFGFYTEEVRRNGIREGFDVVTLNNKKRAWLARELTLLKGSIKYKVGKYGVLIQEFEKVALPALEKPESSQKPLLVVDEIGKMEFFSEPFKSKIKDIFSAKSDYVVLATIPMKIANPLIDSIRNNSYSKVWVVTKENRNFIHDQVLNELTAVWASKE